MMNVLSVLSKSFERFDVAKLIKVSQWKLNKPIWFQCGVSKLLYGSDGVYEINDLHFNAYFNVCIFLEFPVEQNV